jgi:hypothetical protein
MMADPPPTLVTADVTMEPTSTVTESTVPVMGAVMTVASRRRRASETLRREDATRARAAATCARRSSTCRSATPRWCSVARALSSDTSPSVWPRADTSFVMPAWPSSASATARLASASRSCASVRRWSANDPSTMRSVSKGSRRMSGVPAVTTWPSWTMTSMTSPLSRERISTCTSGCMVPVAPAYSTSSPRVTRTVTRGRPALGSGRKKK